MRYFNSMSSILNRKAVIKKLGNAAEKDELGQYPAEEQTVATVWAGVLSGRAAETQLSRTTHKVVIRYRKDVTPDMWLIIGGQRYDILYILDPYLQHERLEIFCEVRM